MDVDLPSASQRIGLLSLPRELIQRISRQLQPAHVERWQTMLRDTADVRLEEHKKALGDVLALALSNQWLYGSLRSIYWEHPLALTGATAKQLKRVVEIQPSVLPLVQTLDLRRGVCLPHHVKSIAKHDRHSCRSTVSLALDRLSPAFINIHTLFLPARQAKDFDYTRFPMLDLVHIGGFHRKPKLEDVVGMLMPLKHVRTIELGPVSNSYATDAEDARDDAVLQTLWNGSEIAVKQPAAAAHDEEQDTDEDEMAPPPPPAQLPRPFYEYLMDYRQLRHLVLLDQLWCQPAMWSAACAYPQLHSLTIGCGTLSLTNLDIILGHLSPTLQQLQLDVSHHNESWWNAHDAEMTLSNMSVLVELDLVQHGGPRVHGPTLSMFRAYPSLRTIRIAYRNGEYCQRSHFQSAEEPPDLEDLQQLAICPDHFPALVSLHVVNRHPFRWDIPFGMLFHTVDEALVEKAEVVDGVVRTLVSEGWPVVRVRKAVKIDVTVDGAREWLMLNVDTPGIDDEEGVQTGIDAGTNPTNEMDVEPASAQPATVAPAQAVDITTPATEAGAPFTTIPFTTIPTTSEEAEANEAVRAAQQAQSDQDAVFAATLRQQEAARLAGERKARELARTYGVVEALKGMLAGRGVELVCEPEGARV